MFKENCIFYLVLLCCNVYSSDAEIRKTGDATNYTVELYYNDSDTREWNYCNGGLIGTSFYLTSASCIMNEAYHIQIPNIFQFESSGEILSFNSDEVEAIYVPRTFNATTLRDNIAVVKLPSYKGFGWNLQSLEIPSNAVEVGSHAEVATKFLGLNSLEESRHILSSYKVTANIKTIGIDECQKVYHNQYEKGILCAKFDGTNRPENTSYVLPGSVAVVDRKTLVGLLSRKRDLSKEVDDVQVYTDIYSYADFISNAVNDVYTKDMHYCVTEPTGFYEEGYSVMKCEELWE